MNLTKYFFRVDLTVSPDVSKRIVVSDANVLINLLHIDRLDLIVELEGYEFLIPENVNAEITRDRERLDEFIQAGWLTVITLNTVPALELYADLVQRMGKGEAACLALAEVNGWLISSDEKKAFLREVEKRLAPGSLITTPGLMLLGIRANLMTLEEADVAKALLEVRKFRMSFGSFRELLPQLRRTSTT